MRRSLHVPIAPGRTFGAWVCLALAVVMLWAPMGAAAWHQLERNGSAAKAACAQPMDILERINRNHRRQHPGNHR